MVDGRELAARLGSETEAMVAEVVSLAAIDSGSGDAGGIARVCDELGRVLSGSGFVVAPRREGGLAATMAGQDRAGPRVLIVGHADTVWPSGTAAEWAARRDGDLLSGPGVGDMKGCLVMAAHACAAVRDAGGLAGIGALELLVVPDEELGSVGSRAWIERRARDSHACLGLEAGWPGGGLDVERGAVGALRLTATGRTAHAAGHEGTGASAVAALAPLVASLERLSRPEQGRLVTVGVFRGGVARQVVPDHAEQLIDLRAPTAAAGDELLAGVRSVVAAARTGEVGLQLTGGVTRPAFPRAASEWLWARAVEHAAVLRIAVTPVASRGGSDASFPAALGLPTLDGLGPICHDSCARGERIEISSLATRGALMGLLIADLGDPQAPRPIAQARDSGNVDAPA
jgi:glutamate carboxypeptidase